MYPDPVLIHPIISISRDMRPLINDRDGGAHRRDSDPAVREGVEAGGRRPGHGGEGKKAGKERISARMRKTDHETGFISPQMSASLFTFKEIRAAADMQ